MNTGGWIGVDLDGTLAHYEEWGDGSIGAPIPAMVDRVVGLLAQGIEVRIVTARVGRGAGFSDVSGSQDDLAFCEAQRALIDAWCLRHLGVVLPVTASKDFRMVELWDDRCRQVVPNTGRFLGERPNVGVASFTLKIERKTPATESVLEEAHRIVHGPREDNYGHPLDNFTRIAALWDVLFRDRMKEGEHVTWRDVPAAMRLLKEARHMEKHLRENLTDNSGYCGAEERAEIKERTGQ